MGKRKRPSEEPPAQQEDENLDISSTALVKGLCNLLFNGSTEWSNVLVGQLRDLERPFTFYELLPDISVRHKRFKSLLQIAKEEAKEIQTRANHLPTFELNPVIATGDHHYMSQLQQRYCEYQSRGSPKGLKHLPRKLRKYYVFWAMQEQAATHGAVEEEEEEEYNVSMVGGSCWTPAEKAKFFSALERCGRGDIIEISRRLGPTKTVAEVGAYLNMLDAAAKGLDPPAKDDSYSAREMSNVFVMQEIQMAAMLESRLETETFAKHKDITEDNETIQKALALFNVWDFSSLTRIFAGINDMTVLNSALANYYQLVSQFVKDIIVSVYTELLGSKDKTVSRALMNHVIAKRERYGASFDQKGDVRLRDMDIMSILDGRRKFHRVYSANKSASFLAKKRRRGWEKEQQQEEKEGADEKNEEGKEEDDDEKKDEDESNEEGESNEEEEAVEIGFNSSESGREDENKSDVDDDENESEDDMLKPFDEEDELHGHIIVPDEKRQHLYKSRGVQILDEAQVLDEEASDEATDNEDDEDDEGDEDNEDSEDSEDDEDNDDEELIEEKMRELDKQVEVQLSETLEFYSKNDIISKSKDEL